jgi:hypothetical protein
VFIIYAFIYNYSLVICNNIVIICRFMPPKKYMEVSLHMVPTTLVTNSEREESKS